MKIDVIGGSGFIGTRLVDRLVRADGHSVRIIDKKESADHPNLRVAGDVRSKDNLRATISDSAVIINLAAEHRDDVRPISLYYDVNVQGAENICAVAREKNVSRIVFTSSVAIYGFPPPLVGEDYPTNPFNHYGRSKAQAEQVFREWQGEAADTRSLVIVRPTVVFGERNRGNVYNLFRQIARNRFVMIGSGSNRKSMAYVENVAAFLEFSLAAPPGVHTYNFVDKPDYSMNELVGTLRTLMGQKPVRLRIPFWLGSLIGTCFDVVSVASGKRFPISAIRVKKFCANSTYSTAVGSSGFVSPVPLQDAIARTVRFEFIDAESGGELFYTE